MSMKSKLAMLAAIAMITSDERGDIYADNEPVLLVDPKQSKPPKGCKEYWFNESGEFSNGGEEDRPMRKDETVFYCHASNDKNAVKKFNKWKQNNNQ